MSIICTTCGDRNADGARFCNNCGAALSPPKIPAAFGLAGAAGEVVAGIAFEKKDELIGRTIEGRYHVEGLIGLGGMGSVYRVTRVLIGDEVAMKILHTERVMDPHAAERFRREAQAAAKLKHPNAVSIYDFGVTSDGLQFLVMELLEGQSLRQIIKQQGPLAPEVVAEITTQVCAALAEAHRQHIVHRDIKPDNIIIHPTSMGLRVKVLDFGIAKLRDDMATHLTKTGNIMGTPHYMSPEQCLGEEIDSRSDIYSMGIVLYEMLCGRVPFNSPISTAVVIQHVNQPPPPLRSINSSISPQVEAVVLQALQKQPEARPADAGLLARQLSAAVHSTSAATPQDPPRAQGSGSLQPATPITQEVTQSRVDTPTPNLAPATVHLPRAHASGPTPAVRSTAPSGSLVVAKPNRKLLFAVGAAVVGFLLMGIIVGLIAWSLWPGKKTDTPRGGDSGGRVSKPTPPAGMAYVPDGKFTMGNNAGNALEQPAHVVTIKGFFVDIYEVTREDYQKFIDATGRQAPAEWLNGHYPHGTGKWPVTGVSWDDAVAYAKHVGKRLPTEEEWEFAARGTDGRRYPWGNSWKREAANAATTAHHHVEDVGEHDQGASPSGAFDMSGNAAEWTATDLAAYPGGQLPDRLPDGTEVKRGKVIRGGDFHSNAEQAATTYRRGLPAQGEKYDSIGFRCVKDLPQTNER